LISYWYGLVHGAGAPVDLQARAGCHGYDPIRMGTVELLGGWEDYGQAQTLAQYSVVMSPNERVLLMNKLRSTKYVTRDGVATSGREINTNLILGVTLW